MNSRLKVALVASSLGRAGAEKQFCYIARALVEAGVDARVYHLGAGGHYAELLRESEVPYQCVKSPGKRASILMELTQEMLRFRPHIVLASQFGDVSYAGIAGRLAGSFVIAGIRSSGARDIKMYGARGPWMMRLAHAFMTNSTCARQNLAQFGVAAERIAVLPNVIDLGAFDAGMNSNNPVPKKVLAIAVGRMHANKRFEWFLESLAVARQKAPQLAGMIVGGDEGEQERLQARAIRLGLGPEDLIFHGECANVAALLKQARMLVLTSRHEGFPNAILEAMSARLPIITTPAGDAPVLVQHGRTGYVANSIEEIASRMATLAASEELSAAMGSAGRMHVETQFQYPCLAPRLLAIFRNFASERTAMRLSNAFRHSSVFKGASVCQLLSWVSRS